VPCRKQGTKGSLVDGNGISRGCVAVGANRNDSLPLAPTLKKLSRFGFDPPERITVHLDAGYDSGKTRELLAALGCDGIISLVGAVLAEQTNERAEGRRYLGLGVLARSRMCVLPNAEGEVFTDTVTAFSA